MKTKAINKIKAQPFFYYREAIYDYKNLPPGFSVNVSGPMYNNSIVLTFSGPAIVKKGTKPIHKLIITGVTTL